MNTPGSEVAMVSPENRLELLFDDILFEDVAQEEHLAMCSVFEKVAGKNSVLQITKLVKECFRDEESRAFYIDNLIREQPSGNYLAWKKELSAMSADELMDFVLTGRSKHEITAFPIPNLMFTRDLAAVVDDHIILSRPSKAVRVRESLMLKTVLYKHPLFADKRDKIIELPPHAQFEGGDLLVISDRVVLIGHSERTSFSGVFTIAEALFEKTSIEQVYMVDIPKRRSCMHLDTVLTMASQTECVVFPPIIQGELNKVTAFDSVSKGALQTRTLPSVQEALNEAQGQDVTLIPCGGLDILNQRREQWTDGSNLFTLAPGVVVGYARNEITFETLKKHGYRIVDAEGFLSFYRDSSFQADEKMAIKLAGKELSRGRGGPRCMTLPISRKSL